MARSKRRDDIFRKKGLRRVRREKRRQRDAINASIATPKPPPMPGPYQLTENQLLPKESTDRKSTDRNQLTDNQLNEIN